MALVTFVGCIAAVIVGLTQVYKATNGAVQAYKEMKKEKKENAEA